MKVKCKKKLMGNQRASPNEFCQTIDKFYNLSQRYYLCLTLSKYFEQSLSQGSKFQVKIPSRSKVLLLERVTGICPPSKDEGLRDIVPKMSTVPDTKEI